MALGPGRPRPADDGPMEKLKVAEVLDVCHRCLWRRRVNVLDVPDAHVLAGAPGCAHLPFAQPQLGEEANLRAPLEMRTRRGLDGI